MKRREKIIKVGLILTTIIALIHFYPKLLSSGWGSSWTVAKQQSLMGKTTGVLAQQEKKGALSSAELYQTAEFKDQFGTKNTTIDKAKKGQKKQTDQYMCIQNKVSTLGIYRLVEIYCFLTELRLSLAQQFLTHIESKMGGLVISVVWGGSDFLHPQLKAQFAVIGIQHIASASGYNVGLLVALITPLLSRFWGFKRVLSLVLITLGYVVMAGGSASLWRAGGMAMIALIARWQQRQYHPFRSLLVTTGVLWWLAPQLVRSISFQLSASATLGLMLWQQADMDKPIQALAMGLPPVGLTEAGGWGRIKNYVSETWKTSLAVQSLSAPLVWHHFGEFAPIGLLSNVFLLWLVPWLTKMGVLLFCLAWLEQFLVWKAWLQPGWLLAVTATEIVGTTFLGIVRVLVPLAVVWQLPALRWELLVGWWVFVYGLAYASRRRKCRILGPRWYGVA